MKKYILCIIICVCAALAVILSLVLRQSPPTKTPSTTNQLRIPELIDSRQAGHNIAITIQNGNHEFFDGIESDTKGFNGDYLGPTIRLYQGEDTRIRFTNKLAEDTTVHGHGLHVPGEVDGGPHNVIAPGETWDITLPIRQQASTNWYHPHLHGKTAEHVHAGLAGFSIIEDENSTRLPVPKNYGVDDIPLVVQDRGFTDGIMNTYSVTDKEMMDGKREDTLVINGTIDPYIEVPQGWVRLRLLNGSHARVYDFHLENNEAFYKIATEGGFLEKPVEISSLRMTPGERNEIMIDMSDGNTRQLLATLISLDDDRREQLHEPVHQVLELRVDTEQQGNGELPETLNTITFLNKDDAVTTRTFELSMFAINGKSVDMSRIDDRIRKGDIEVWEITRETMDHPFHVHGTSFQILSHNGRAPAPEDRGWKDTLEIGYGSTELIMKFDYEATEEYPYMYHCHMLEHEDGGMMGQFTVE